MNDFPYVAPPPDGLREAMTHARHRRFRTAGVSTSGIAAAAVVVMALVGGAGTQSLVQQPAPEQPAVTQLVPGPDRVTTTRTNVVSVVTGRQGAATRQATRAQAAAGPAAVSPGSSTSGAQPGRAGSAKPYAAGNITRLDSAGYVPTDYNCPVNGGAQTFCPDTSASQTAARVEQLYAEVCTTKAQDTTMHFDQSNEVDFAIYKGAQLVWQWSRWHPERDAPHTVVLGTGGCSQWTFDWTLVDFRGAKLPTGDYTLETTFFADELAGKEIKRSAFSVT